MIVGACVLLFSPEAVVRPGRAFYFPDSSAHKSLLISLEARSVADNATVISTNNSSIANLNVARCGRMCASEYVASLALTVVSGLSTFGSERLPDGLRYPQL